jgi:hypothetical protein
MQRRLTNLEPYLICVYKCTFISIEFVCTWFTTIHGMQHGMHTYRAYVHAHIQAKICTCRARLINLGPYMNGGALSVYEGNMLSKTYSLFTRWVVARYLYIYVSVWDANGYNHETQVYVGSMLSKNWSWWQMESSWFVMVHKCTCAICWLRLTVDDKWSHRGMRCI